MASWCVFVCMYMCTLSVSDIYMYTTSYTRMYYGYTHSSSAHAAHRKAIFTLNPVVQHAVDP